MSIAIDTLREQLGPFQLREIRGVKFLALLHPEETFTIEGERTAPDSIHFRCLREGTCIAEGRIIVA